MSHVYFPHDGFIALAAEANPDELVQLGIIGSEGMLGLFVAAGADRAPLHAFVHGEGHAAQVDAAEFAELLRRCPSLQQALFEYSHHLTSQIAQMAVCNAFHSVPARLARWLLTTSDQLHSQTIRVTQEQMASALGVKRLAVNLAAKTLHDEGVIGYRRGVVSIEHHSALKEHACPCYGIHRRIFDAAFAS